MKTAQHRKNIIFTSLLLCDSAVTTKGENNGMDNSTSDA